MVVDSSSDSVGTGTESLVWMEEWGLWEKGLGVGAMTLLELLYLGWLQCPSYPPMDTEEWIVNSFCLSLELCCLWLGRKNSGIWGAPQRI